MYDGDKEIESVDNFKGDKIWFRARVMDKNFTARFYYSLDGVNYSQSVKNTRWSWDCLGPAIVSLLLNFTTNAEGVDGYVDFNWFRFTNK